MTWHPALAFPPQFFFSPLCFQHHKPKQERLALHLDQPGLESRRSRERKGLCWGKRGKGHGVRSLNLQAVPSSIQPGGHQQRGSAFTSDPWPSDPCQGSASCSTSTMKAASGPAGPQTAVKQALRWARGMRHCAAAFLPDSSTSKDATPASHSGEEDWATVGVKASPHCPATLLQMNDKVGTAGLLISPSMQQECWGSRTISGKGLRIHHCPQLIQVGKTALHFSFEFVLF